MRSHCLLLAVVIGSAFVFGAAAPQLVVNVGDRVGIPEGVVRSNYPSKILWRTLETINFVDEIKVISGR